MSIEDLYLNVILVVVGALAQFLVFRLFRNTALQVILTILVGTSVLIGWYLLTASHRDLVERCEMQWSETENENTVSRYRTFLEGCNDSEYAARAQSRIAGLCEAAWENVADRNSIPAFERHSRECRDTASAEQASLRACEVRWHEASQRDSEEGYAEFRQACPSADYPVGERVCGVRWRDAVQRDELDGYQEFQRQCTDSPSPGELNQRMCGARWREAAGRNDIASYREFLGVCEGSEYAAQATASITTLCDQSWLETDAAEALAGYQSFARSCPDSRFQSEARESIEEQCARLWRRTQREDTVAEYQAFAATCPATRHWDQAQYQIIRGSADRITRNYALIYNGCQIYVRPDLSPERQQDAIEDATQACRRRAERERRGPGPGITDTILAVIIGVCAAGGC
ncbi:MAG: hypothetical protein K2X34_10290 [Hyphomonadaceae bacterium]|nr:hypothetical protein [Hyphomonadaceae bacterium]